MGADGRDAPVAVDATRAFVTLLAGRAAVNLHRDEYLGNFRSPDGTVILITFASSGFRLCWPVVWWSTGARHARLQRSSSTFDQAHLERLMPGLASRHPQAANVEYLREDLPAVSA